MRKTIKTTYNLAILASLLAFFNHFAVPIQQNFEKVTTALSNIASFGKGANRLNGVNHPFY